MWGPTVVRWFINPMNTIVIGTINHSDIGVISHDYLVVAAVDPVSFHHGNWKLFSIWSFVNRSANWQIIICKIIVIKCISSFVIKCISSVNDNF